MQKFLNYEGLQTLVERIKSCYLLEIGVSGGAWAIMVDSTADRAEINAIVEGNAPMPIAVKLHMADNDTDYIVNTCQVRGGYFMLYIPDDMVLTDMDGTEFTGTWMTFMADSFSAAVDYYATSVDLRNSTQVITDTSKATSSNVLYLVADSSRNVSGVVYNSKTYTFAAEKGEKGDKGDTGATGVGITSVKQTVASMISGDTNVVEITTSDGKTSQVKIRNGNASTSGTEIVQTPGQATDKVMSQKGVHDYVNQRLMDSAQSHSSFGSGFCYKLNARQIELLEASDVITLEICAQINGGLNGYNNTAGMIYFDINFGNNHARFSTTNDGAYAFTGDSKLNPLSGSAWQLAATQTGVEPRMPNDRVLMVIDRRQGIVRLYDKCSRKIIECQRDAYKCDTWLGGDDWLAIMTAAKDGNVADLWALRIYDRDVEPMKYNNNITVSDSNFVEAILPFQYPSNAKAVQVQDYAFTYKNAGAPWEWPKARAYDPNDGLLTGTNDTTDWLAVGATGIVSGMANMHVREVDFEVTGGKWRVNSVGRILVFSCVNSEGADMGINGYYEMTKTSADMPAGRYTMKFVSQFPVDFADIAAGATIKHYGAKIHTLHCVANINPRYYCNGQCWDDARQEWWTPLDIKNHSTPVVPTFTDAAWRSVPAPALLSQPSFNGQLKVDDSGKVYVGVCVGASRTWKQINNT